MGEVCLLLPDAEYEVALLLGPQGELGLDGLGLSAQLLLTIEASREVGGAKLDLATAVGQAIDIRDVPRE